MRLILSLQLRFWNWVAAYCDRKADRLWTEYEVREEAENRHRVGFVPGNMTIH